LNTILLPPGVYAQAALAGLISLVRNFVPHPLSWVPFSLGANQLGLIETVVTLRVSGQVSPVMR
jgi:uncharacterized membrane protein